MLFEAIINHVPDRIALSDGNRIVIYGDLLQEIQSRVQALSDVSVVALALDNSVDWVLWDLAALKAGITCVPVPPFFTKEQTAHLLRSAGVSHIVSHEGLRDTGTKGGGLLPKGTAKVTFTSGTTGAPKGVCLSKSALARVAESIVAVLGDGFVGTHISVLPLAVLLENVAGVYAGLLAGCSLHLPSLNSYGTDYSQIHSILKDGKANSAILVPEILRRLMGQIVADGPLPNLQFVAVGGSKIDPGLIAQARALGLPVYEGYGLSECGSVVALNTPDHDKPGTVGRLLPHVRTRILNGEIQIKNPGFLGYIGEQAPPVFSTGDLGDIDEDGFLRVSGRKKNVLITSYGRNVSPEWVESTLLTQPDIAQAVVFGDARPHLSALVVPAYPEADIKAAIDKANTTLPDYARIYEYRIVAPFTMANGLLTGTGRPRRAEILTFFKKETSDEFLQSTG